MNESDYSEEIRKAVDILNNGGIIVYPAGTVYGIGCDPMNMETCKRVQCLKQRLDARPMLLLAYSLKQVEETAVPLSGIPRKLAKNFWPGPLTIILTPQKDFPQHLLGSSGGAAFRVTSYPLAASLARDFGCPIISTSANITGKSPVVSYEKAVSFFGKNVDIILRTKEELIGKPSTVVDVTSGSLVLVREGSLTLPQLQEVL